MPEYDVRVGAFGGDVEVLLRGIAAMGLENAVLEVDGCDEELRQIVLEESADHPEIAARNARVEFKERRFGPIGWISKSGDFCVPITPRSMARLIEMASRSAGPEIAICLSVCDNQGPLLSAPDIGDDEIWVNRRLSDQAVRNLRAVLGDDLTE